jgi:hypothetical protein
MSVKRRLAIVCGATVAAASLMVGPTALAAPTKGDLFTLTCPDATFEVVAAPGQGTFTPAFVGTHQVFIPYRITAVATVPDQPDPIFMVDQAKKGPVPAAALTCELEGTFTSPDGTIVTVTGTVVVVLRGAP